MSIEKYQCRCGCHLFYLYFKDRVIVPRCVDCENEGEDDAGWKAGLIVAVAGSYFKEKGDT